MNLNNQIELELYFADHFDTILFPVLAEMYLEQNDLRRARKVCDIGLKHHSNDSAGLFVLAQVERSEGNLKEAEKILIKKISLGLDLGSEDTLFEFSSKVKPRNFAHSIGIDLIKNSFSIKNEPMKQVRNNFLQAISKNNFIKNVFFDIADKGLKF